MDIRRCYFYLKLHDCKEKYKYDREKSFLIRQFDKKDKFSKKTFIAPNTVVIIEPNPFHAETLPGYISYFLDLKYNVDVFITYENAYEKPFVRMNERFRIFIGAYYDIQKWLKFDNLKKYEIIFFNTLFYNQTRKFLPSIVSPAYRNKVFGVVHSFELYKVWLENSSDFFDYNSLLHEKHFASLLKNDNLYQINPNYFGNIKISKKSDKNIFVAVGAISANYKNHNLLLDSVRELLREGISNFEIHIIGAGKILVPEDLQKNIIVCGRLDFPSMYTELEKADFILALLDPYNSAHKAYLHGTTSGSLQLSFGFLKPLVINTLFANAYCLNSNSAVIYQENQLKGAMQQAIEMSVEKYNIKQDALEARRNQLRCDSIKEMQRMIRMSE